ncbi:hypothetical protein [Mycobacterium sp. 48b]
MSKAVISPSTGLEDPEKVTVAYLVAGAELQGTIPMWQWIGDDPATTFSY